MALSIVCSKAVVLLLFIYCLLMLPLFVGVNRQMLVLFCSSFLSFLVLQSSRLVRESLVLWCVLKFVSLLSVLLVPWVGVLYVVVAFPGHIHLPFGFPVASRPNIVCDLDIHLYDEQEHNRFETFYSCA